MKKKSKHIMGVGAGTTLIFFALGYLISETTNLSRHLSKKESQQARLDASASLNGLIETEWDEYGFIRKYQDAIREAGELYGIPPSFIAGVIYYENATRQKRGDVKDALKSWWGGNVSLGPGQEKLNVALFLDDKIASLRASDFEEYKRKHPDVVGKCKESLQDPVRNIEYVARYLHYLAECDPLYKKKDQDWFRRHPEALVKTGHRYRFGIAKGDISGRSVKGCYLHGHIVMEAVMKLWMQKIFPEDASILYQR